MLLEELLPVLLEELLPVLLEELLPVLLEELLPVLLDLQLQDFVDFEDLLPVDSLLSSLQNYKKKSPVGLKTRIYGLCCLSVVNRPVLWQTKGVESPWADQGA